MFFPQVCKSFQNDPLPMNDSRLTRPWLSSLRSLIVATSWFVGASEASGFSMSLWVSDSEISPITLPWHPVEICLCSPDLKQRRVEIPLAAIKAALVGVPVQLCRIHFHPLGWRKEGRKKERVGNSAVTSDLPRGVPEFEKGGKMR